MNHKIGGYISSEPFHNVEEVVKFGQVGLIQTRILKHIVSC